MIQTIHYHDTDNDLEYAEQQLDEAAPLLSAGDQITLPNGDICEITSRRFHGQQTTELMPWSDTMTVSNLHLPSVHYYTNLIRDHRKDKLRGVR